MKLFKKALAGVAVAAALATSAQASMITVGGVTWDPDATGTLADNDFTARYSLVQWFTSAADSVANTLNSSPDPSKAVAGAVGMYCRVSVRLIPLTTPALLLAAVNLRLCLEVLQLYNNFG